MSSIDYFPDYINIEEGYTETTDYNVQPSTTSTGVFRPRKGYNAPIIITKFSGIIKSEDIENFNLWLGENAASHFIFKGLNDGKERKSWLTSKIVWEQIGNYFRAKFTVYSLNQSIHSKYPTLDFIEQLTRSYHEINEHIIREKVEELKKLIDILRAESDKIDQQSTTLEDHKGDLKEQANQISQQNTTLNSHDSALKEQAKRIRQQNTTLKSHDSSLEEQANQINQQSTTLEEQANRISQQKTTLNRHAITLSNQANQISQQDSMLKTHADTLSNQANQISQQDSMLKTHAITLSNQAKQLQDYEEILNVEQATQILTNEENIELIKKHTNYLIDIACGNFHILALDIYGQLWSWGYNYYGQLGDGTRTNRSTPVKVKLPDGVKIVKIYAGGHHSLAIDDKGQLWSWGYNVNAQLGDGTRTNRSTPVKVKLPDGVKIVKIYAGVYHSLAIDDKGQLWSWGYNYYGQLGDGTTTNRYTPVKVKLPDGVKIVKIYAGGYYLLAIDDKGQLWSWGYNSHGQLGDGTTTNRSTPVKVKLPDGVKIVKIYAGGYHSLAIDDKGQLWSWGYNYYGQLGDGTRTNRSTPVKVKLPDGVKIVNICAGGYHSLAIDDKGQLWSWGYNYHGQLGDGTTTNRSTPVKVKLPDGFKIVNIYTGSYHSLATDIYGQLWSWGYNYHGQLGIGNRDNQEEPVKTLKF